MKQKNYEIDMCHGPLLKKMLLFALPLIGSSMLQLLFNAADIVVVGRFAGDHSMAAVGSTTSIINLLTNMFVGLSVGANVLVANLYGAGKREDTQKAVHTAIVLSIYSGVFLTVVGVLFTKQILLWMDTPKEVVALAATYLRILFLGMTGSMVYNFGSAVLRAVGDTKRPMYYLLGAGVVNVILNLLFVIVLKMDVAGVALATVISQLLSAGLVIRCLLREKGAVHLELNNIKMHSDMVLRIFKIGVPAGFQGIIFAISNVVIQASVNSFGATVVAGNAAAMNVESFIYFAMNAFYQAALTFSGQNVGAGQYQRLHKITLTAQICVIVTGVVMGNMVVLFGKPLLSIYTSTPAVIVAGQQRFRVIARTYALCGIMDVMVGVLRGMGYSILPMMVSLLGACGLRLLWIFTIFQIPHWHTMTVLYLSYSITWMITFTVHIICYLILYNKHFNRRKFIEHNKKVY